MSERTVLGLTAHHATLALNASLYNGQYACYAAIDLVGGILIS